MAGAMPPTAHIVTRPRRRSRRSSSSSSVPIRTEPVAYNPLSTTRRQPCILMHVHPVLPLESSRLSFLKIARMPSITSLARLPSPTIVLSRARTCSRSGLGFESQRSPAAAPVTIAAKGCLISCAIEAAICPAAVKRKTRVSSFSVARSFSSARLLSVMSITAPINISGLYSAARAIELWPHITVPSLRRYRFTTA